MFHGSEISSDDAMHAHASIPGGGEFRMERMPAPLKGVIVHIPDGDPIALLPDQWTEIRLQRKVAQLKTAPYMISYHRLERDGNVLESIGWQPSYRAQGRLKLPGCEVNVVVFDFNGDGVFDRKDSRQATTLGLDTNLDGHVDEWHKMEEILDVCGTPLQVAELDPTGVSMTFRVSELKTPSVGDPVPQFSVATTAGGALRSDAMRGSVHLLDFWASWCAPCVAELDDVAALARRYPKDLKVYGIDVDEPERRAAADRIVKEKSILFPQVVREQGEKDYFWKMFGSMAGIKLFIPLFVVVDQKGTIQYASTGGENLVDLKAALERLMPPSGK
jgi:thiol-disulfide isomerase/thioredoxin